jgi:MFS family permease
LLWFELSGDVAFSIWRVVRGIDLVGLGSGLVIAALFSIILAAVKDDEIGSASGVLNAVQSIASSVGVAVFGSTFFHAIESGTADHAFQQALYIQAGLLVAFLALTFLLPRRGRPDDYTVDPEAAGAGSFAAPAATAAPR